MKWDVLMIFIFICLFYYINIFNNVIVCGYKKWNGDWKYGCQIANSETTQRLLVASCINADGIFGFQGVKSYIKCDSIHQVWHSYSRSENHFQLVVPVAQRNQYDYVCQLQIYKCEVSKPSGVCSSKKSPPNLGHWFQWKDLRCPHNLTKNQPVQIVQIALMFEIVVP